MEYKLIALDIDDTMLTSSGELSPRVKAAIYAARDKGVEIVIATGRMHRSAHQIMENMLGMGDAACICFGGSQVLRGTERLYNQYLPPALAAELLHWAHDEGLAAMCYMWDSYVFELDNEHTRQYGGKMDVPGIHIPGLRGFGRIETPKVVIVGEPERLAGLEQPLSRRYEGILQVARSMPQLLEFNGLDSTKGAALAFYAALQGYMAEECIAVGDSRIDASMIAWAGLGVAMGNGADEVKQAADVVAPGCDEDGVAWVIEEYILGEAVK